MRICYFGNYQASLTRNHIYMKGLRENGAEVFECNDKSRGFMRYWRLWKLHKTIPEYDVMIVGYSSYTSVFWAKLLSRTPVVFDALCTYWEAQTLSHEGVSPLKTKIVDWIAIKSADLVLVETEHQKRFFEERFGGKKGKYRCVYTGVDDEMFFRDPEAKTPPQFTVLFRGRLTPEAGVKYVLEAAQILKNENIYFSIIGFGEKWNDLKREIMWRGIKNVDINKDHVSLKELRRQMSETYVSLGQFEDNPRLSRTIPNKAFESLSMKIPYITARADGVSEFLTDGESCLMVNVADGKDLAEKILEIKNNPKLAEKLTQGGYELYQKKLTPKILGGVILHYIESLIKTESS